METEKKKQTIKFWMAVSIIALIVVTVIAIMIRYEVEGDQNMPYNLSKIVIVSTAEGIEKGGETNKKWRFNIFQNNDIYFYIDKNTGYMGKEKLIEKVRIENIQITVEPKIGEIKTYMPNSVEGRIFEYSDEYLVQDKLEYRGGSKSNSQTLEIGSQGGNAIIRFSNTNFGEYSSDKDTEIIHDGTLLNKLEISEEDIKFEVTFDFIISVDGCTYKSNIKLNLPCENIMEQGTSSLEITDMSNIVFKRVN